MKPLKFSHITKTAGTSIENEGKKRSIFWGRWHLDYGWHHGTLKSKPSILVEKYDWFTVVRNPYTRIISEFHCTFGGMGAQREKMLGFSKGDFNNYLIKKIKEMQPPNKYHLPAGQHYTPQHYYTHDTATLSVLKFENLKPEFNSLMEKYKLSVSLNKHENSNPKIFYISDINQKLRDLINKVYEKDFEYFNYDLIPLTT